MTKKRVRRSKAEAHRLILDATEAQLALVGPAGIRLQQIAATVNMTHNAILHHFGSRAGLIDAVVERGLRRLETDLLATLQSGDSADHTHSLLSRIAHTMRTGGHARLLAWLMMSAPDDEPIATERGLERIALAVHANRPPTASFDETRHMVLLVALTLFGDALAGPTMRKSLGLAHHSQASNQFVEWLAAHVRDSLGSNE